jgi:hypothetical protein
MKKIVLQIMTLSGILVMSSSCDSTRIISSYEAPNVEEPYSNIYVVGISGESMPETQMEDYMVKELDKKGYVAAADEDTFDPKMEITEDNRSKVEDKLNKRGYDGILTFSLVDVDEELDYVSGAYAPGYYPASYGYYNSYWGYYGHYAPMAYDPGYYTSNTVYHMEANLYDVESGKLVWAARSETIEPVNASTFAENFAETVANELEDEEIISDEKKTAMK